MCVQDMSFASVCVLNENAVSGSILLKAWYHIAPPIVATLSIDKVKSYNDAKIQTTVQQRLHFTITAYRCQQCTVARILIATRFVQRNHKRNFPWASGYSRTPTGSDSEYRFHCSKTTVLRIPIVTKLVDMRAKTDKLRLQIYVCLYLHVRLTRLSNRVGSGLVHYIFIAI